MTLWDMLDKTLYYQEVWIYENNSFDQNMPLFKGTVSAARQDQDTIWDYLMCEIGHYECNKGILVLFVINKYYGEKMESHYMFSDKWTRDKRPWKFSSEIQKEIDAYMGGGRHENK